jgi:hypothetical protein
MTNGLYNLTKIRMRCIFVFNLVYKGTKVSIFGRLLAEILNLSQCSTHESHTASAWLGINPSFFMKDIKSALLFLLASRIIFEIKLSDLKRPKISEIWMQTHVYSRRIYQIICLYRVYR